MESVSRKWWILLAATLCLSLTMLDQTIITVALKTIQIDLHASQTELQWVVNAYLLTFTGTVITLGKLADIIGHKRSFLIGTVIFTLASLACGLSRSIEGLIISRAFQGLGSSFMYPPGPAIVNNAFPLNQRGRATGILTGVAGAFLSAGPFLGGFIVTNLPWSWIFYINLPVGIAAFLVGFLSIPKDKKHPKQISLDLPGSFLLFFGLGLFVFTLMEGPNWGWFSLSTLGTGGVALFLILIFLYYLNHSKHPLIDFKIFKIPCFSAGAISLFIGQIIIISSIYSALFFQGLLTFTPLEAGLALLPIVLPLIIIGPINGFLIDHFGPRVTITIGLICCTVSCLWIALFTFSSNYWWLMPGYTIMGCGLSFVLSTGTVSTINLIPAHDRSSAMGIILGSRQLGSTLGVAIMGLIIVETQMVYLSESFSSPDSTYTYQEARAQIKKTLKLEYEKSQLTPKEARFQKKQEKGFAYGYSISMFLIFLASIFITIYAFRTYKHYKGIE